MLQKITEDIDTWENVLLVSEDESTNKQSCKFKSNVSENMFDLYKIHNRKILLELFNHI